jgi:hypothetical protein
VNPVEHIKKIFFRHHKKPRCDKYVTVVNISHVLLQSYIYRVQKCFACFIFEK